MGGRGRGRGKGPSPSSNGSEDARPSGKKNNYRNSAHLSGAAGKSAGRKGKSPPSTAEKASDTGELDFTSPSEVPLQTVVKQTEGELEMLRAQVAAQQSIIEQLINSASEKGFDTPRSRNEARLLDAE